MNSSKDPDPLFNSCYCTHITKVEQVHQAMKSHGDIEGLYLVRNSFSDKGRLVLSVRHTSGLVHVKIGHNRDKNTYSLGSKAFKNMDALLIHFSRHPIENEERLADVLLKHPIRADRSTNYPIVIQAQKTLLSRHTSCNGGTRSTFLNGHDYLPLKSFCRSDNPQRKENHLRHEGYLTPTFTLANKRRLPSPPSENQSLYVKAHQSHPLPRGWSVASEPGREVKFISPSGTVEDNLPAEVWIQLNDRQSLTMQKLLSVDGNEDFNHVYMDMNKANNC